MKVNISEMEPGIYRVLRRSKFSDREIAQMTPEEAFNAWCNHHGYMNKGAAFLQVIDSLRAGVSEKKQVVVT